MKQTSIGTILAVVAAVVIAWILVNIVGSVLWFLGKLVIVAVVAIVVYFIVRHLFSSSDEK